jgi:hypothetical protein
LEGEVDVLDFVAGGEDFLELGDEFLGDFDVVNAASAAVVEMGVFLEVGAVAGGLALEVDLANEAAGDEGFETIVNSGEGDGGHGLAGAGINLVSGRVVAFVEKDGEDVFALAGGAQAGADEGFVEDLAGVVREFHGRETMAPNGPVAGRAVGRILWVWRVKLIGMIPKINPIEN